MKVAFIFPVLFFALSSQATSYKGSLPSTFLINENSQVRRTSSTCHIQAAIEETAESFRISSSTFECPEISWSDTKSLFKRDGVLYDRLGVAVGNHYESGTLHFPTTTSQEFSYTEKVFDRNCKAVGRNTRQLPLIQTVVYAFQPNGSKYNLSIEVYWEKPVRKQPISSCPGAEAWQKIEDQGRIKGVLQAL